jgi:hypothetical protein
MKRDAFNHPKTLDLASRLDITRAHAVGILTLLFDFCAMYSAQGDIGKHRNGAITRGCDWAGNPDEFIRALVDSGWLDEHPTHRLLIHDWSEHCEQWVKLKLQKLGLTFLGVKNPAERSAINTAEHSAVPSAINTAEASASRDPNLAYPSLAKPSQAHTSQASTQAVGSAEVGSSVVVGGEVENFDLVVVDRDECCRECLKLGRALEKRNHKIDADTLWRWSWLATSLGQHGLLSEVATKVHSGEVTKPKGYVESALRRACTERGKVLSKIELLVPDRPRAQKEAQV